MTVPRNGKRRRIFYDLAAAFEDLYFTKAFGPGILAALFYGLVSGSMSFVNKIVLTSYSYHFPNVMMLAQVVVTSVILEGGRLLGFSSMLKYTLESCSSQMSCNAPHHHAAAICCMKMKGAFSWAVLWKRNICRFEPVTWGLGALCDSGLSRGRMFFFPSICFALHTTLALRALDDLSIPMYNVLRRLLPLSSLLFACCMLKKKPSIMVVTAVVLVVLGCIIAGFGDLEFSALAYIYALASVVCQSFYLTYIQKTGVEKGFCTLTVLHTNSVNCIPLLFLYTIFNNELLAAFRFDGYDTLAFQAALFLDVSMGCLLSYSLFLCTTMNSALTTSLVGVVKGVSTTIIGFFTFGGVPVTALTIIGIFLNTLGGAQYTYAKYAEKMTSEIEKHFHKHTIKVKPVTSDEHKVKPKNGLVGSSEHGHEDKPINGFVHKAEVVIDVESDSGSTSGSEMSVE